jgi:uridine kinase
MNGEAAEVLMSVSTWQQPMPVHTSPTRSTLLAAIVDCLPARGAGRLRVGIDGVTAAGKTTFGHELARVIADRGRPVLRVGLDDFKRPWPERHRYDRESGEGYYRNAFDYDAVRRLLLEPAAPNGSGQCVLCSIDPLTQIRYTHLTTPAPDDAVLVVDGVFAFRRQINAYWDFRIWLHVDEQTSLRRGAQRDGQAAQPLQRSRYAVAERLYLSEEQPLQSVDVIVDNTSFDEPEFISDHSGR